MSSRGAVRAFPRTGWSPRRTVGPQGLRFDAPVPPAGYAWWYVDIISDDGACAMTIIAFVGAAFSPAYFRARTHQLTPTPASHCAINVAVYGQPGARWALTEHPATAVSRTREALVVGRSALHWEGDSLRIDVDERTPILGRRIRGRVRLWPRALHSAPSALDPDDRHLWWCLAPVSRVRVELEAPHLRFEGSGYWDANYGREPLDLGMADWDWARARVGDDAIVMYDARPRRGAASERAWRFDAAGGRVPVELPSRHALPRGRWGLARRTRCDAGGRAHLVDSLEDGPFYARSLVRARWGGRDVMCVHESISLDRFRNPIVRTMLPFRMRPRWLG